MAIVSHGSSQYRRVVASTPIDGLEISVITADGTVVIPWLPDTDIFEFLRQKDQYLLDLEEDRIPSEYLQPPVPPTEFIEVPVEVEVIVEKPVFASSKALLTFVGAFAAGRLSKH